LIIGETDELLVLAVECTDPCRREELVIRVSTYLPVHPPK
jgi:hypothetical protein